MKRVTLFVLMLVLMLPFGVLADDESPHLVLKVHGSHKTAVSKILGIPIDEDGNPSDDIYQPESAVQSNATPVKPAIVAGYKNTTGNVGDWIDPQGVVVSDPVIQQRLNYIASSSTSYPLGTLVVVSAKDLEGGPAQPNLHYRFSDKPGEPIYSASSTRAVSAPAKPPLDMSKPVHVTGYYKKNGTYVREHTRNLPGTGSSKKKP